MSPGRVGVVHPFWPFWQHAAGSDFRASRAVLAAEAELAIGAAAVIAWSVTLEPDDHAPVPEAPVEAVVVVVTIACPPTAVLRVLQAHPRAAVVLWALTDGAAVDQNFGHSEITRSGATVGVPMIGAALSAAGRPFQVLTADCGRSSRPRRELPRDYSPHSGDQDTVTGAIRCAVAAGRVRHARIGVIGDPLPGYEFTAVPETALVKLGTRIVPIAEDRVGHDVRAFLAAGGASSPDHLRAAGYCAVLDDLVRRHDLQAGSLNCHSAQLRHHPAIGAAPCFALGESTSRGVPWTCTGDVATAFAMLVVASLDAPTLYNEIEAIDEEQDIALLANSGEHDTRFEVDAGHLGVNPWYPGPPFTLIRTGAVRAGPAALVAAHAVGNSIALVVADGQFTGEAHPRCGTMNATFRFDSGPVRPAWRRWSQAGVGHHSCATDRRLSSEITVLATYLGITVEVC